MTLAFLASGLFLLSTGGGLAQEAGVYEDLPCYRDDRVFPRTWVDRQRGPGAWRCPAGVPMERFTDTEFPRQPGWKPLSEQAASDPLMPASRASPPASPNVYAASGAADAPAPGVGPSLPPGSLAESLDAIVRYDSQAWMMNRYDYGSISNARFRERSRDGRTAVAEGDYSYNGGMRGWIRARIQNGQVSCIEYHDFPGNCRAVGDNSHVYRGLALVAAGALATAIMTPDNPSDLERCMDRAGPDEGDRIDCSRRYGGY